jgi:hypothetical protein
MNEQTEIRIDWISNGLTRVILGQAFDLKSIKPENAIVVAENGAIELVSRIIPYQNSKDVLVCTLSRRDRDGVIFEKGYDYQADRKLHLAHENQIKLGDYSYERHDTFLKEREKLGE